MLPVPGRRIPQPSLLRSHPETADRIRRLLELGSIASDRRIVMPDEPMFTLVGLGTGEMTPRYRWPGLWF
jgi:heat shock protein HtpX